MKSLDLIDGLVDELQPVSPLASPATRLARRLAASVVYVAAVVMLAGVRPDLADKLQEPRFLVEITATTGTAVLAAVAALGSVSPGRSRWLVLAPLPAFFAWIGSLGEGCWRALSALGMDGLAITPDWYCFPAIATASLAPTLIIILMTRRGMADTPVITMALATLAATSLGAAGLRLFHPQDASVMVLIWQFGTVAMFTILGACAGRPLLPRLDDRTAEIRHSISGRAILR